MLSRLRSLFRKWPRHPIDILHGIETSAPVARVFMRSGDGTADADNIGYVGSQPSVVDHILDQLPIWTGPWREGPRVFYDLGCGKGRVLVVAAQRPFDRVVGIELSRRLVQRARRNMRIVRKRAPEFNVPTVVHGSATQPALPEKGVAVAFLYNPFRSPQMSQLLSHIEAHGRGHSDFDCFLLYYNPTQHELLDTSPAWRRIYTAQVPFDESEQRAAVFRDASAAVAIWQLKTARVAPASASSDLPIRVTTKDLMAWAN